MDWAGLDLARNIRGLVETTTGEQNGSVAEDKCVFKGTLQICGPSFENIQNGCGMA